MVRHARLMAVVGVLLIASAVLLVGGGCSGVRAEASQEEMQGRTEATKEQGVVP